MTCFCGYVFPPCLYSQCCLLWLKCRWPLLLRCYFKAAMPIRWLTKAQTNTCMFRDLGNVEHQSRESTHENTTVLDWTLADPALSFLNISICSFL